MNWKEFLKDTNNNFKHLAKEIPETFSGFASMGNLPKKDGAFIEKGRLSLYLYGQFSKV